MLASAYNEHPKSALISSKCLTPAQAQALFASGATFEAVVFPDASGEEVARAITSRYMSIDGGEMPRLERFDAFENLDDTVRRIHETVVRSGEPRGFFTAGGG